LPRVFVSYIATIVEVAVDDKGKFTCPGRHRDRLRNLCQSGTHRVADRGRCDHGAESAKYGEITFKDGKVQQGNFDDFPVIRMDESPVVTNVYIVPPGPDTPPSGVGEPGVPPFARR